MAKSPEAALFDAYALHGAGQLQEAEALYREILKQLPNHPEALHHLGLIEAEAGRLEEADRMMTKSDRLRPGNPYWRFNIGRVAALRGDLSRARRLFESVVAQEPRHADALLALGTVCLQASEPTEARDRMSAALRLQPTRPDILSALGVAEFRCGNGGEAERLCREAVRAAPNWADGHNNLGFVLRMLARYDEATVECRQALVLQPEHAEALVNLGLMAHERRSFAEARDFFERALRTRPNHPEARFGLAEALIHDGRLAEGRALLDGLIRQNPRDWRARWASLVSFPIVYESQDELETERRRFADELERLAADVERYLAEDLPSIVEAVGFSTNFHLHYTGGNVRPLQEPYGRLITRIAAAAYPAHGNRAPSAQARGGKLRVGIASSFLYHHSMTKTHGAWISDLPRDRFEVVVFQLGGRSDARTQELKRETRWIDASQLDQRSLIDRIADERLDVLIWPDIGMDAKVQIPAALRLAPVQAVGIGHPVTTGLSSIDTFLSSDLMEPPDAEAQYTETLVRLPNLSVRYPRPKIDVGDPPPPMLRLKEEGRTIYLCAQSLFKLIPAQDDLFARIAAEVPQSTFVFIAHPSSRATEILRQRLLRRFEARGIVDDRRLLFLPRLGQDAFLAANKAADVVLDSLGWSGFNSTMEALAMGAPVVCWPGSTVRARHSYGVLRMAGLDELIAADEDAYVALAVRLGTDRAFRDRMRTLVRERASRVFDDPGPVAALADWVERTVSESGAQA